jgi:hypothetical protein
MTRPLQTVATTETLSAERRAIRQFGDVDEVRPRRRDGNLTGAHDAHIVLGPSQKFEIGAGTDDLRGIARAGSKCSNVPSTL